MTERCVTLKNTCPALVRDFESSQHNRWDKSWDKALRSLYLLYVNTWRLNGASPTMVMEFLGAKPPRNPYSDMDAPRYDLAIHPIHKWLVRRLPTIMEQADTLELPQELDLIFRLLSLLISAHAPQAKRRAARRDKARATAVNNATRLRYALAAGVVRLDSQQRELLDGLLSNMQAQGRRRQKLPGYPALQLAAREMLLSDLWINKSSLFEFATLAGIDCDAVTARRYLQRAGKVWGGKYPSIEHNFSLLAVLQEDYQRGNRAC